MKTPCCCCDSRLGVGASLFAFGPFLESLPVREWGGRDTPEFDEQVWERHEMNIYAMRSPVSCHWGRRGT